MKVEIDKSSGFCFGVVKAISKAEEELTKNTSLFSLGTIVHNNKEVERLQQLGLRSIDYKGLSALESGTVLFRAHGEPPSTYRLAQEKQIPIIDATCPVVLQLQKKIRQSYMDSLDTFTQIVIYGQIGHAEVNGLVGQTNGSAMVIETKEDALSLDFTKPIILYSQTTKSIDGFREIVDLIGSRIDSGIPFLYQDTICRQFSNRIPNLVTFARLHDVIFFVADPQSSNGKMLYAECKKANPNSYLIYDVKDIDFSLFQGMTTIGISGATSTPKWMMESVKKAIESSIDK